MENVFCFYNDTIYTLKMDATLTKLEKRSQEKWK